MKGLHAVDVDLEGAADCGGLLGTAHRQANHEAFRPQMGELLEHRPAFEHPGLTGRRVYLVRIEPIAEHCPQLSELSSHDSKP